MQAKLTILGSGSATPLRNRYHSAQVLEIEGYRFLLDCGEGTQWQLIRNDIRYQRLDAIFITHLHGDHYLGLMGLLNTMSLNGRRKPLIIISPPGLKSVFDLHMKLSAAHDDFPIEWRECDMEESSCIWQTQDLKVSTIPLVHRIPSIGFYFEYQKWHRHLIPEKCDQHHVPKDRLGLLAQGKDITLENGQLIRSEDVSQLKNSQFSYAYLTDTIYIEKNTKLVQGVNVLFHEATFLDELSERAEQTYHSTAKQAAIFASKAEAGQLIIGHYSSRYRSLDTHLSEAKEHFENTLLAKEGEVFEFSSFL